MKDLQLKKESLANLQDDQLENIIGGTEEAKDASCNKKSCGNDNGDKVDIEVNV